MEVIGMFINPQELPKVAVEDMNDIHQQEVEILNKLFESIQKYEKGEIDIQPIKEIFKEFMDDVIAHFSFENNLMQEFNFFAYNMHRAEHDRVIYELKSLEKNLEEKSDINFLKDYLIYNFKPWLISHIQSMDTVTAMFLTGF